MRNVGPRVAGWLTQLLQRDDGLRWIWITVLVIVADLVSKFFATTFLSLHEPVALMPSLNFLLAYNSGAAFSFLSSASGWQRWFFVIIAVAISIMIVVWLRRMPTQERLSGVALSFILGGAIANVWDRIQYGYVIDFIDVYYGQWHWPVFNLADSAITLGAVLLIIDTLFVSKKGSDE